MLYNFISRLGCRLRGVCCCHKPGHCAALWVQECHWTADRGPSLLLHDQHACVLAQVRIQRPDATARFEILKVHARGKPIDPDVDLQQVSVVHGSALS